jgi:hypothetical protein
MSRGKWKTPPIQESVESGSRSFPARKARMPIPPIHRRMPCWPPRAQPAAGLGISARQPGSHSRVSDCRVRAAGRGLFRGYDQRTAIGLLRSMYAAASGCSKEIKQVQCRYLDSDQRVWVINSDGLWSSTRALYAHRVVAVASTALRRKRVPRPGIRTRIRRIRKSTLPHGDAKRRNGRDHAARAECPAGLFPVVIDGGFGGVIFHEACGHSWRRPRFPKETPSLPANLASRLRLLCKRI